MYIGQLQWAGLAKESVVGTLVTPPTLYVPFIPSDSFYPKISLLESTAIRSLPDVVYKVSQGPGQVNGMKLKCEFEPEMSGNLLMAAFGVDTVTESASFVVTTGVNDKIDFKENGGTTRTGTVAAGTYIMGTTSATSSTLCKAVKTAMEGASGAALTYTVTYSYSTKKVTITASSTTVQILWNTGSNTAIAAKTLLGFTNADTAAAIAVTSDSTTTVAVQSHLLTRLSNAQLPSYSWEFAKGAKYFQFVGSMLSKIDIDIKAKEYVTMDMDWTALAYDDTGITQTPSYSAVKPLKFDQCAVNIDGSPIKNYDNIKVSIDNMVKADHAISGSIYPAKIYSEGMKATISMDLFMEDAAQWNKFRDGTTAALNLVLTSSDDISGAATGKKYTLTIDIPTINYMAANLPTPKGVMKIAFTAVGVYTVASTKTLSMALVNGTSAAY